MKKQILLLAAFIAIIQNLCLAQAGYQYNGATNTYEYNSDPFGGMAQRYQNYTQMQTGTLQRLDNYQQQIYNSPQPNSTNDVAGEVAVTVAVGKNRIAERRASNFFNWKFENQFSTAEIREAEKWKANITRDGLQVTNYADVKAFVLTYLYNVANGVPTNNTAAEKAQAQKLELEYLKNDYIQGMTDQQRTANNMSDFATLNKLAALGTSSPEAKRIAAEALANKGLGKTQQPTASVNNSLENKGAAAKNKPARTTFNRVPQYLVIQQLKESGKITEENINRSIQYLKAFDNLVKKINGPNNDHAFAQALIFSIYYSMYSEGTYLSGQQLESVIKLFYNDIINDPNFQADTDTQLQQFYEQNAVACMAISDAYANAKKNKDAFELKLNDPKTDPNERFALAASTRVYDEMKSVQSQVHQMLKDYFQPRNFDDYKLTKEGFVKK